MVASVNQGARAEAVGKFVQLLWNRLDRQLFRLHRYKPEQVEPFVARTRQAAGVKRTHELDDARVLRSAARYLAEAPDLVAHAAQLLTPSAMVEELGRSVEHFGKYPSGARKKAWMYLRWMVRPAPDLHLFTKFRPRDLQIPLDVNT